MPITYACNRESGIIRTRCTGNVTFEEVIDHFRVLGNDPTLPARLDVLLDLSEMNSLPESDQLKSVSMEVGRLQGTVEFGTIAIVASSDVLYGMSRIFEVFSEGIVGSSRVFRELAEAEGWLASARSTELSSGSTNRDGSGRG